MKTLKNIKTLSNEQMNQIKGGGDVVLPYQQKIIVPPPPPPTPVPDLWIEAKRNTIDKGILFD
jgi:bacteriocin-like protein